jgi:hypothetical protein
VDLRPEPVQNVIVEADRDAGLTGGDANYWTTLGMAEVVFAAHISPHIEAARAASLCAPR